MLNGRIYKVIVDNQESYISDIMKTKYDKMVYKIGKKQYSKVIDRQLIDHISLYKYTLANGQSIITSHQFDIFWEIQLDKLNKI